MPASKPYFYGVGKRKTAIARVRVYQDGTGKISVNGAAASAYFIPILIENAQAPLIVTDQLKKVDIETFVKGGGKVAQSDAIRLGVSRCLTLLSPDYRTTLKSAGFLRRDSRIKERKKPGLKRARRAPQFSKR